MGNTRTEIKAAYEVVQCDKWEMKMRSQLFVMLFVASISGCTVLPSVEYRAITTPDDMAGMTDAFYRQQTKIEISVVATNTAGATAGELLIVSRPAEYRASKLGIKALTDWRSSTVVTLNKYPNTDLINSIGIEVTDITAKAITEYGGAFVKLIGLGVSGEAPQPCIVSGPTLTLVVGPQGGTFDGNNPEKKGCISVTLGALPPDAMPADKLPMNQQTHNFYYSACRDATVTIKQATSDVVKTLRVADPSHVQFVQFPPKGTITSHSECGVSVQTDKAAVDNGAAVVNALATQGKAIKDALDAAAKK